MRSVSELIKLGAHGATVSSNILASAQSGVGYTIIAR